MTVTLTHRFDVGDKVTYAGDNRDHLRGKIGTVTHVADNGTVAVEIPGEANLVWAAEWAWNFAPVEKDSHTMVDNSVNMLEPHIVSLTIIENELKRLKARIAELESAKKVLESL